MENKNRYPLLLAEDVIDTIRESVIILDETLKIISANNSFYANLKLKPQETEGKLIYELSNGQWNIPDLIRLLRELTHQQGTVSNFSLRHSFENIGLKVLILNARKIIRTSDEPSLILLGIEDITTQYATQKVLE